MLTNKQPYERLIRVEDEELESSHQMIDENDSYRLPMRLVQDSDRKQVVNETSRGINLTINGKHIRLSAEQLKYISLVTLTFQNAALNLVMRAARTQPEQFSSSVAVTIAEIFKTITCVALIFYEDTTVSVTLRTIKTQIVDNYVDTIKVTVPSLLYYIQNNLLYIGSTHLDAATGQITYQLKILTTAIFSVAMLGRRLTRFQWMSLVILFAGVALIETTTLSNHSEEKSSPTSASQSHFSTRESASRVEKPILGFVAILIAACLSGFAGVYFEKILKSTNQVSLWIRNIQLSVLTIPIGLFQVFIMDHEHTTTKGLFYGFTPLTWLCIVLQAQGGLLVAIVVKFANNISKGFATSMAIVISTTVSMFMLNFSLTPSFALGASLVIGSVMMYSHLQK